MVDFMQEILAIQFRKDKKDGWIWACDPVAGYTVKSAYLAQCAVANEISFFKTVWRILAPSKVLVLERKFSYGRLPMLYNLLKRGVALGNNNDGHCAFCSQHVEEVSHMFFGCAFSHKVWMGCYAWLGVENVLFKEYDIHFFHHKHWGKNKKQRG